MPLKCDACGEPMPAKPLCVAWCLSRTLTYSERQEQVEVSKEEQGEQAKER
jgi:Fe-S-cluster-containing hydrogenase component 2